MQVNPAGSDAEKAWSKAKWAGKRKTLWGMGDSWLCTITKSPYPRNASKSGFSSSKMFWKWTSGSVTALNTRKVYKSWTLIASYTKIRLENKHSLFKSYLRIWTTNEHKSSLISRFSVFPKLGCITTDAVWKPHLCHIFSLL